FAFVVAGQADGKFCSVAVRVCKALDLNVPAVSADCFLAVRQAHAEMGRVMVAAVVKGKQPRYFFFRDTPAGVRDAYEDNIFPWSSACESKNTALPHGVYGVICQIEKDFLHIIIITVKGLVRPVNVNPDFSAPPGCC